MFMKVIWREPCLRFFIYVLVLILWNLENKVLKKDQKLAVFYHKIKTKA